MFQPDEPAAAPPPISAELDTMKYEEVLHARRLVAVLGARLSYDGLYTVDSVTHKLMRGESTRRLLFSREGTGTTLPAVIT